MSVQPSSCAPGHAPQLPPVTPPPAAVEADVPLRGGQSPTGLSTAPQWNVAHDEAIRSPSLCPWGRAPGWPAAAGKAREHLRQAESLLSAFPVKTGAGGGGRRRGPSFPPQRASDRGQDTPEPAATGPGGEGGAELQ